MRLVEQNLIRKSDSRCAAIDRAAFAPKNLYNQANYQIRQAYIYDLNYHGFLILFVSSLPVHSWRSERLARLPAG